MKIRYNQYADAYRYVRDVCGFISKSKETENKGYKICSVEKMSGNINLICPHCGIIERGSIFHRLSVEHSFTRVGIDISCDININMTCKFCNETGTAVVVDDFDYAYIVSEFIYRGYPCTIRVLEDKSVDIEFKDMGIIDYIPYFPLEVYMDYEVLKRDRVVLLHIDKSSSYDDILIRDLKVLSTQLPIRK